ncbi:hypothetical protein [Nitrospira sp. Nam80]
MVSVFNHKPEGKYCHSSATPQDRFNIPFDKRHFDAYRADLVKDFSSYGPNEQYLLTKILFSKVNLLLIVGSMGTGKTRFRHFLIDEVLKRVAHPSEVESAMCPFVAVVDFLDITWLERATRPDEVLDRVSTILCDRIEAAITDRGFFTLDQEVTEVWEAMLKNAAREDGQNEAVDRLRTLLRDRDALPANIMALSRQQFQELLHIRKSIRTVLLDNKTHRRAYWAAALRYVKEKFFANHENCCMLFVDNIDAAPLLAQQAVKVMMKPFARASKMRTIITLRQTTYYQHFDDRVSEPIDVVAHCGPSPLDIVLSRMMDCAEDIDKHSEGLSHQAVTQLAHSIPSLVSKVRSSDRIREMMENLCGYNIRKALILAQNLVDNSCYDVLNDDIASIKHSDILRALFVGNNEAYQWTNGSIMENIFQVQAEPDPNYLIKLRILALLCNHSDTGMALGRLRDILAGFGYSLELLREALNELLVEIKELVWSDRDLMFETAEQFASANGSLLFVGQIGRGYRHYVYKQIDYVQEVMLDTYIKDHLGVAWDYGKLEQRFRLVSLFTEKIVEMDIAEVKTFLNCAGVESYRKWFGKETLLSLDIAHSIRDSVRNIMSPKSRDQRHHPEYIKSDEASKVQNVFEELLRRFEAEQAALFHKRPTQ